MFLTPNYVKYRMRSSRHSVGVNAFLHFRSYGRFWWMWNCNLVVFSIWEYCGCDGRSKSSNNRLEHDMDAYVRKTRSLESVRCYKGPVLFQGSSAVTWGLEQLSCILGTAHELLVLFFQSYETRTRMPYVFFKKELEWHHLLLSLSLSLDWPGDYEFR